MKKLLGVVATLIAATVCVAVACTNAEAKAKAKAKKQAPATMQAKQVVQDETCVEEVDPCRWEAPAKPEPKTSREAYYEVPIPAPEPYTPFGFRRLTEKEKREEALKREFNGVDYDVKHGGKQWKKKSANCGMLCLVKQAYYSEAKQLADKYGVTTPTVNKLANLENLIDQLDEQIGAALDQFDSSNASALAQRKAKFQAEQKHLLAGIASVGSCRSKANPWACFKKRVDWYGAFKWAEGQQKKEAAVNACLQIVVNYIGSGCKLDMESSQPVVVGCGRGVFYQDAIFPTILEEQLKGLSLLVEVKKVEYHFTCVSKK